MTGNASLALDELVDADIAMIAGWDCDERTHYFWCGTVMSFPPRARDIARHVRHVSGPSHLVRAVRVDGQIGGFIELDLGGAGHGTLERVLLAPHLRGHGLGPALMVAAGQLALAAGVDRLHLVVSTVNTPAVRTYLRAGFVVDETVPAADRPWTKHLMTLTLGSG